ncbi:MAG: exodeoxyribonuclease VII large subunit [Sphingomonadaceae bacterium]
MATTPNTPEYSVSELSRALKRTIEAAFGQVRLRGEISGFKRHSSGHLYFTLKDTDACIDAVMWKGVASRLEFRPEDGLEVVAIGRLSTYPRSSRYQIVVERLEIAGVGALLAQIEERRRRLAAEGLFAPERKRRLPFVPVHIGVITSPTGAVIRDILHRLSDRFPRRVTLWPVPVQGEGAAPRIAAAIAGFNAMPAGHRPDLLIVARGGGSVEDLMAFNAEEVVRAAAGSEIPLISAVGHETDTTLIDHAADIRAPTPTAAAELAVPVRAELAETLAELLVRAGRGERRARAMRAERLQALSARVPRPAMLLGMPRQRLDDAGDRLGRALFTSAATHRARFQAVAERVHPRLLTQHLARERMQLAGLGARLPRADAMLGLPRQRLEDRSGRVVRAFTTAVFAHRARLSATSDRLHPRLLAHRIAQDRARLNSPAVTPNPALVLGKVREGQRTLAATMRLIDSLSPEAVLRRGFVLVSDPTGGLVKSAAVTLPGASLHLRFADGEIGVTVDGGPTKRMTPRPAPPQQQGKLF